MSSLAATLLAQSSGTVRTRQALIVTGLQNDFISPDGKLPMSTSSGFIKRIKELVPAFREHGNIIWVWTEYRGNRQVNDPSGSGCMVMIPEPEAVIDPSREQAVSTVRPRQSTSRHNGLIERAMRRMAEANTVEDDEERTNSTLPTQDPELFLSETPAREACCKPGTWGAEPISEIKDLIDPKDIHITKSYYSAFFGTSLLLQLRAKLVTDLYFAGCNTNLSVYATATDVARHGLEINIIEDCLGCRQRDRHEEAVKQMVSHMGAEVTTAYSVISRLRGEDIPEEDESEDAQSEATSDDGDGDGVGADDAQFSTGPVRQSPFLQSRSESSMLSQSSSSTAAIDLDNVSGTSVKHPESTHDGSSTGAARYSFITGAENQYQATAPARELLRWQQSKSAIDGLKVGESRATDAERELTTRTRSLDTKMSPVTHHADTSLVGANAPSFPKTDEIPAALHKTINPPIGEATMTSELQKSAADSSGETPLARVRRTIKKKSWQRFLPTLGPGDAIGSGDSSIAFGLLPPGVSDTIFQQLLHEVNWQRMYHAAGEVPRLVCCQGDIDPVDGSMPVYRHPADQTLPLLHWSPGIARVRREVEKRVGHRLNHVLIQLYRSGQDHISEHSDKTLDIAPNSCIVNVSFGAQRTMRLRTKRAATTEEQEDDKTLKAEASGAQRTTQRIPMPHNSMFVMSLDTNSTWLHGIMPDKRLPFERTPAELAYNGMRISLTFRHIATYLSSDSRMIWGQGATSKERRSAHPTINDDPIESQSLIDAFGFENQNHNADRTNFDWHRTYGSGFDVLHLKSSLPDRETPMLFLSGDEHADLAVKLYLSHLGISITEVEYSAPESLSDPSQQLLDAEGNALGPALSCKQVVFRDADSLHTQVSGESAILLYLDRAYARYLHPVIILQAARETEILTGSLLAELRDLLRQVVVEDWETVAENIHQINALRELDDYLLDSRRDFVVGGASVQQQQQWLAGAEFGIADCAFWSVIQAFRALFIQKFEKEFAGLNDWAGRVQGREEVARLRTGRGETSRSRGVSERRGSTQKD